MRRTFTTGAAALIAAAGIGMAGVAGASAHEGAGPGTGPGNGLREGKPILSESVIQQQDGTFVTVRRTVGDVTAVSSSSITVKAANGTSSTFVVNATTTVHKDRATATIESIAVGDTVHVLGTVTGSTATALRIGTGDHAMGTRHGRDGRHGHAHRGGSRGAQPSTSASPSA